jgi:hypothetical protein
MARAMSTSDTTTPKDQETKAGPVDGRHPDCTGPLLHAVAGKRPTSELLQLVTILNGRDQSSYAQQILNTAATVRPVEDVAAMIPLLSDDQAASALHAAATQRGVEELARLVTILNDRDQLFYAQEILNTAATMRPVEDVAAMVPLLGDSPPAHALHAAAAQRPIDELVQLVERLSGSPDATPAAQQARRRLRL